MEDSQQRGDIKIFRTISYLVRRVTAEKVAVWRVFCSLFNLISPHKSWKSRRSETKADIEIPR